MATHSSTLAWEIPLCVRQCSDWFTSINSIITVILWGRSYYYLYSTDEETAPEWLTIIWISLIGENTNLLCSFLLLLVPLQQSLPKFSVRISTGETWPSLPSDLTVGETQVDGSNLSSPSEGEPHLKLAFSNVRRYLWGKEGLCLQKICSQGHNR